MRVEQEQRVVQVLERIRGGIWSADRPHLMAVNDMWHCFGAISWARGATMQKAYDNWVSVPARVKSVC